MDSRQYWNNKIIEWEDSMHDVQNLSLIEKLASYFRGPVKWRGTLALETVRQFVQGKTVLELGCGSGYLVFDLCAKSQVKKLIGMDISENAINRAKKICREKGLQERCEFYTADVANYILPTVDLTIGLGFLDYLTASEIESLFKKLGSKYFLFSLTERKMSILRYIHMLYLVTQRCPKHFYHTKEEILKLIGNNYGNIQFINDKRLSFACLVHNLPINSSLIH